MMHFNSAITKQLSFGVLAFVLMAFTFWKPAAAPQLEGRVVSQNKPLAGVTVTASQDEKTIATTTTDAQGAFQLALPEGKYTLEFAKNNYETLRLLRAPAQNPANRRANIILEPALTQRQVTTSFWSDAFLVSTPPPTPTPPPAPVPMPTLTFPSGETKNGIWYRDNTLKGHLVDEETKDGIIGATVLVKPAKGKETGVVTDINGNFQIPVEPGVYDVIISYYGYETIEFKKVTLSEVFEKKCTMRESSMKLDEVVTIGYTNKKSTKAKERRASEREKKSEAPKKSAPAAVTPPATAPIDDGKESIKVSRISGETKDAPREVPKTTVETPKEDLNPYRGNKFETDLLDEEGLAPSAPEMRGDVHDAVSFKVDLVKPAVVVNTPQPAAGVLTAGEWNDLDNWNRHWSDMLKDGEIDDHQRTYGFFPKHRYTVLLLNEAGFPAIDVPVTLTNAAGATCWQARTDNTGKAELWYGFTDPSAAPGALSAYATLNGRQQQLGTVKSHGAGINRFTVQRDCQAPKLLDIMWAVDATGSMGDEISYLKTELLDVIVRVQRTNKDLTIRMGATFYRDNTDAYLVKSSGLSPDIQSTVAYIQDQYADGGGDTPEAVHSALEEVVFRQKWSDEAVARICFLILDASPHQTPEINANMQRSIQEAARRGIRIVPVSASGIQKDTEFLMKFFGLATNGSYVFLTDHSGVGNKHLEPTTDEYKVEAFNDLLVRLINQYASVATCNGQSLVTFENQLNPQQQSENNPSEVLTARFFPNPASDVLQLVLPTEAVKVTMYDAEGKAVYSVANLAAGQHTIPVHTLADGYYNLRIWAASQVQSGKVLVVKP